MGVAQSKKRSQTKNEKKGKKADYSEYIEEAEKLKATVQNKMAPFPANESERIQKLLSYNVLDSAEEQAFDDLTELASSICETPIALVSLVDSNRQWFKSRVGLGATETSREAAFCSYAILDSKNVLMVNNALEDERFQRNELVLGFPNIRFYAGAPLITPDGFALGTLCAIDTKPRELSDTQVRGLQILSKQVVAQLEVRKYVDDLKQTVIKLEEAKESLKASKQFAEMASISSFENLLLSPVGQSAFMDFLSQEFCSENLEFWKAAKEFRDNFSNKSKTETLFEEANQIYLTFIKQGSPKQVNVFFEAVRPIEKLIESQKVEENMFEEARGAAFEMMKNDSYEKFLSSDQYKKLTSAVRQIGLLRLQANEKKV